MFEIRGFHLADLTQVYRICLQTADSGEDARALYQDPDLLGHFYAAPYAVLEPELCFILTHQGTPCGYILGTKDSQQFAARCETEWFPVLRQRYPLPRDGETSKDAAFIRLIHKGHSLMEYPRHPAELHIDLLSIAQGQGWGKKMIEVYVNKLLELNIPGVHLGVGKRNLGAIAFYQKLGFEVLQEHELWWAMGKVVRV